MYIKNKEWYKSKAVLAGAAGLAITVLSAMLGSTDPLVAVLVSIATGMGIYGRVTATTAIKQ